MKQLSGIYGIILYCTYNSECINKRAVIVIKLDMLSLISYYLCVAKKRNLKISSCVLQYTQIIIYAMPIP